MERELTLACAGEARVAYSTSACAGEARVFRSSARRSHVNGVFLLVAAQIRMTLASAGEAVGVMPARP